MFNKLVSEPGRAHDMGPPSANGKESDMPYSSQCIHDFLFGKRVLTYWGNRINPDYSQMNAFMIGIQSRFSHMFSRFPSTYPFPKYGITLYAASRIQ